LRFLAAIMVLGSFAAFATEPSEAESKQENKAADPKEEAQPAAAAATTPPPDAPAGEVKKEEKKEEKKDEKVSAGSAVLTPEQLAKLSGFFFSASLDHFVGIGTFVDPTKYAYLAAQVNAFVSYRTQIKGRAIAFGLQPFGLNGLFYEYTPPDSSTGKRANWSDARIAVSMPALIKESFTGIVATPSFNVIFPTTPESWNAGLITRVGLGLSANRVFMSPIGMIQVGAGGIGTFGAYRNPQRLVYKDNRRDPAGNPIVLCRTGEQVCGSFGNNPMFAIQASMGVTWSITDFLFASISYGLQPNWTYSAAPTIDEYTPKCVDTNGNPCAQTGINAGIPLQSASVSVSFNITDVISGSLYVWNWGPIYSLDMKRWRFPYWDTEGPANNYTVIGFSLGATY
jgi:hypothetical protein